MRILQLSGWYAPTSVGGTEVYVAHLARACRDAGHDVRVAAPLAGIPSFEHGEQAGISVLRYPVPETPTRDEARGRVPFRGHQALHRWVAAWKPDIVHVHSLTTGLGVPEIRAAAAESVVLYTNHLPSMGFACSRGTLLRWGGTPCDGVQAASTCAACLLHARGVPLPVGRVLAALPDALAEQAIRIPGPVGTAVGVRALLRGLAATQSQLVGLASRVIVLNDGARRIFEAHGAPRRKLIVNRLGVSHPNLVSKAGPDEKPTTLPVRLGFVGRYHETKGLIPLVAALRLLPSDLSFTFIFRGVAASSEERAFEASLKAACRDDARVRFLPAVPAEGVGPFLRDLDLLCCPSLWFENGPTVALEAMAVGTPVLASAFGAPAEFIEHDVSGALVPPGDSRNLAALLIRVVRDPRGTIDRWRRGIGPVRKMDDVARDYLSLYGEVASEGLESVSHGAPVAPPALEK